MFGIEGHNGQVCFCLIVKYVIWATFNRGRYSAKSDYLCLSATIKNKLVRLIAVTVCGAANVNKTKDTTHPQG